MIKRTGERILTWIGNALQIFGILLWGTLLIGININPEGFKHSMIDSETTMEDASASYTIFNTILIIGVLVSIIVLVLGILSAIWIGKNNKPAGIILIVIGVVSLFGSTLSGVLWLVSGIMLLVRKPKPSIYNNIESETSNQEVEDIYKENNQKQEDPYKY